MEQPVVRTLTVAGQRRSFRLYLPASYDESQRHSLVLNLHGADDDAEGQAALSDLEGAAGEAGFITLSPEARSGLWEFESNADIEYIEALLKRLERDFCIAPKHVFATGMSQGATSPRSSPAACPIASRQSPPSLWSTTMRGARR